jgi:hypothetical protein
MNPTPIAATGGPIRRSKLIVTVGVKKFECRMDII